MAGGGRLPRLTPAFFSLRQSVRPSLGLRQDVNGIFALIFWQQEKDSRRFASGQPRTAGRLPLALKAEATGLSCMRTYGQLIVL